MASFRERLRVARWFLERPHLYQEFARFTAGRIRNLGRDLELEARDAVRACERAWVDPQTALRSITGKTDVATFHELFPRELAAANETLRQAPVTLHGAGNLDLIYGLTEHVAATRALETGVSAGWSSLAFLLSLRNRRDAKLVSTDMPYPGSAKDAARYVGCVVPDGLRTMWRRIDEPDRTALPKALALHPELDICHYDSDKSYDGRMWAYRQLWRALRPNGVFMSDDIDDNLGFFHFCGEAGRQPIVVRVAATDGFKYVGIVIKTAANGHYTETH